MVSCVFFIPCFCSILSSRKVSHQVGSFLSESEGKERVAEVEGLAGCLLHCATFGWTDSVTTKGCLPLRVRSFAVRQPGR